MSNCSYEAEQLILPLDYPSTFSNLETVSRQGSNTSLPMGAQPYICMMIGLEFDRCNQLKVKNTVE